MDEQNSSKKTIVKRIGGYLHRVTPIVDSTGKVIHSIVTPFQVELKPRDIFQMIVGAYLLCVPVAFTEEVWVLSEQLPMKNIVYVAIMSIFFMSCFIYFNFYRFNIQGQVFNFLKRVVATYGVSLLAVGLFLTMIEKCPWQTDYILAIKRIILVSFPSSMAATISDTIK
tara:strand:- start:171 stop:677 length:507 start_codon:yes stop_codon:yes gene_type:complete